MPPRPHTPQVLHILDDTRHIRWVRRWVSTHDVMYLPTESHNGLFDDVKKLPKYVWKGIQGIFFSGVLDLCRAVILPISSVYTNNVLSCTQFGLLRPCSGGVHFFLQPVAGLTKQVLVWDSWASTSLTLPYIQNSHIPDALWLWSFSS